MAGMLANPRGAVSAPGAAANPGVPGGTHCSVKRCFRIAYEAKTSINLYIYRFLLDGYAPDVIVSAIVQTCHMMVAK